MKIFNIEGKDNNKEFVCYIQMKDLEILAEKGISLEVAKDVNRHIYVFNKKSMKSFVRITSLKDLQSIRNDETIIDFGSILNDKNMFYKYNDELEKEKKKIADLKEQFYSQNSGVCRSHLQESLMYRIILDKEKVYNNRFVDMEDINNVLLGQEEINIPQVPYMKFLVFSSEAFSIYRGINPNTYVIVSDYDIYSLDSIYQIIDADLMKRFNNIEFDKKVLEDEKYLVIRTIKRQKKKNYMK